MTWDFDHLNLPLPRGCQIASHSVQQSERVWQTDKQTDRPWQSNICCTSWHRRTIITATTSSHTN